MIAFASVDTPPNVCHTKDMTQIKKKCFAALAALTMAVCAFADAKTDALINAARNNDTA